MNRAQKRQLQTWLYFRDRRMTVFALIRFNWRVLLLVVMAGLSTVAFMLYCGDVLSAELFAAVYIGVLLRDLGQFIRWSRTWVMSRELMDWPEVERLASENGIVV